MQKKPVTFVTSLFRPTFYSYCYEKLAKAKNPPKGNIQRRGMQFQIKEALYRRREKVTHPPINAARSPAGYNKIAIKMSQVVTSLIASGASNIMTDMPAINSQTSTNRTYTICDTINVHNIFFRFMILTPNSI